MLELLRCNAATCNFCSMGPWVKIIIHIYFPPPPQRLDPDFYLRAQLLPRPTYIWFGLKFSLQQETMLVSYRRK